MKKVTKTFLPANIPLYELSNKHIKNLLYHISHTLSSETTGRKTVLQLSANKFQRIRSSVQDKQFFLVVSESALSSIQYLNISVGFLQAG